MKTSQLIALMFAVILCGLIFAVPIATADETSTVSVRVQLLNGRNVPRKTGLIEARFDLGDILKTTGEWSKDYKWIEVEGGETGTVWVYIPYVSERECYKVKNENNGKIKARKWPVIGRVTGYIRHGETIEIQQKVLNWGKTKRGWVDLDYFIEEVE